MALNKVLKKGSNLALLTLLQMKKKTASKYGIQSLSVTVTMIMLLLKLTKKLVLFFASFLPHRHQTDRPRLAVLASPSSPRRPRLAVFASPSSPRRLRLAVLASPSSPRRLRLAVLASPSSLCRLRLAVFALPSSLCRLHFAVFTLPSSPCRLQVDRLCLAVFDSWSLSQCHRAHRLCSRSSSPHRRHRGNSRFW
ncbi:hypothetical protein OUZ56_020189 [Daphnia magna]|uniref:Uncharacterized protein n=1 Tax=Daphnia magna TaxID=35525 RepID=A0ABQ9ZDR7_9CRUS|nr:hypothetical protein OUZ56_020189 [Daphnia magna]